MRLLGSTLLGLGSALLVLLAPGATGAQAKPPVPLVGCGQRGRVVFDKDATLSDGSGRRVARFSGGESAVTLIAPPAEGSDLVRIETGTGRGSFRIPGLLKASELRLYTNVAVQVVSGHVWFPPGTRVMAAGASDGKVRLEKQVSTPFNQRFSALAECSALTFSPPTPPGERIPGNARAYLMKVPLLDLHNDASPRKIVTTLQRSQLVDSVRFFSTESRAGFVHVRYQGEVHIDGWAKASDLEPLRRGETSDVAPSTYTLTAPPQLQLQQLPRVVHTTRELPLRVVARESELPIGVVEAETDVYVMDTVAGWANVLPKSLHVLPADNLSFWVKATDLGL